MQTNLNITAIAAVLVILYPGYRFFRFRKKWKKRQRESSQGTIIRDPSRPKTIQCLELSPEFLQKYSRKWNLMSLGDYLSSLRPSDGSSVSFLQNEIENTIHVLLNNYVGRIGSMIIPFLLSHAALNNVLQYLASTVSTWFTENVLSNNSEDEVRESGAFLFSLTELASFMNLNQKIRPPSENFLSPIESQRRGEVLYDPTFDNGNAEDTLIPNPFYMEQHFTVAIEDMETIQQQASNFDEEVLYDPNDRSYLSPTPINTRVFPDLYIGYGNDVLCTHTKREILINRLMSVLLTKLSHNFYIKQVNDGHLFKVIVNGKTVYHPEQLIQEMIHLHHSVNIVPQTQGTSFGLNICVKEHNSWSYIPLGLFVRTGFEIDKPVYLCAQHGGISISIQGPLIGTNPSTGEPYKCDCQFYVGIEGLCGFHSNHLPDVPWANSPHSYQAYTDTESVRVIRMAGILSTIFSSIASDMKLPFGGYGVLGVCNDATALIDVAVRGSTNIYPMLASGRFLTITMDYLSKARDEFRRQNEEDLVTDITALMKACCNIQSDLNNAPHAIPDAAHRFLSTMTEHVFSFTLESKKVMFELSKKYSEFMS